MQKLTRIVIKNFRSCNDVDLLLERFTPLVGQNNAGKSTILEGISILLGGSSLSKTDFNNIENPIEIIARFEGITAGIIEKIPDERHQKAIQPYCPEEVVWIRVFAEGGKTTIEQQVWDYEQGQDLYSVPENWKKYPTGLPQAVQALFPKPIHVEAMKDLGKDLTSCIAGTTIKRLLEELSKPITAGFKDELDGALGTINSLLAGPEGTRAKEIDIFSEKATTALSDFFPGVKIKITLPEIQIKEFFKSGSILAKEDSLEEWGDFRRLGSGAQRSIEIALLQVISEHLNTTDSDPSCSLLLIDEPEMYLHPRGISNLRETLRKLAGNDGRFQIIFSTHSPLMVCRESAAHTVLVKKPKKETIAFKPLMTAVTTAITEAPSQSRLLFEIGRLGAIYFSNKVILCEGKTDDRVLPVAYESYFGKKPDADGISFFSLGGSGDSLKAKNVIESMGIQVACLCDFDFAMSNQANNLGTVIVRDQFKPIVANLSSPSGFQFNADSGMPKGCSTWKVADIWHKVSTSNDGVPLALSAHRSCLSQGVWIWKCGTIEDVMNVSAKGEKAIISHESMIANMSKEDLIQQMPELVEMLEWVSTL